ncbi:WD40-repeat-containing domain protein [Crassisporium funariophilum]|nr:WD40-repeat-containing domain protein [Crassisporium funariophilum]
MKQIQASENVFTLQQTLRTPAHVSSLAFGHGGHLFAGSDDGSLRLYDLSSLKVLKAVRGLGGEVSSIICVKRAGSELRDTWIAHGKKISKFQMESTKMILSQEDASIALEVGEGEEEILNELALNADKSHLAFTMDSGVVGVVDLSNNSVIRMETKHDSVCGSVKFVPDRPRELVSGGYDTKLMHWDYVQRKTVSFRQMDSYSVLGEMSMSPPFIMSMAMSSAGVLAAGTADGRLWIGFKGERIPGKGPKKKSKKWEGLDANEALMIKVAEGPIVAMAFSETRKLTISTLLGVLTHFLLIYDEEEGNVVLQQAWQKESEGLEKVNALVADEKRIIVGGFSADGRGVIEIWKQDLPTALV